MQITTRNLSNLLSHVYKGRYVFSLGGGLGNFGIFVCPPLHFNKKKAPEPPPLGDWQECDPPLMSCYMSAMMVDKPEDITFYIINKSMRALWLVNQLWVIVPVNPRKNRASSELLYNSYSRRIRKPLACSSWFTNSSRVLPTSRVVYQPVNHRNLWSIG